MSLDLDDILKEWPHEPGQIKVRKITGSDGLEKIQLRLDLGLIQMNLRGRPDGTRPHGQESSLLYQQIRAKDAGSRGDEFTLTAEECIELQQEGIQYYHRYISLFQLDDFHGVVRDTSRNLDLFNFVKQFAPREEIALSMEGFRPYVLMMNTRARAAIELARDDLSSALRQIERGCTKITEALREAGNVDAIVHSPELRFLNGWMEELKEKRPLSKLEVLQTEMDEAIAREAYERAAQLRDEIRAFQQKSKESELH